MNIYNLNYLIILTNYKNQISLTTKFSCFESWKTSSSVLSFKSLKDLKGLGYISSNSLRSFSNSISSFVSIKSYKSYNKKCKLSENILYK